MGGALRAALGQLRTRGLAAALAVAGCCLLPAPPAAAVSTGRPVAVAVAPDGTAYVGFLAGDRLLRLDPDGDVSGSVRLDRPGPVDALAVDPGGDVWVDYGDSVSELDADGRLLTHFAHLPGGSCPADRAHDPARYGGLEVTAGAVYVAGRCRATVDVYSPTGELEATIDPPGAGFPRGVALAPAYQGLPSRLYVSVPASGRVFMYNAGTLRSDPDPARTLVVQKHAGYRDPEPGALLADEKGQLGVVDVANNAVYFYNGADDYWFYRALGHPPDPASDRGFLDRPAAMAHAGGSFEQGFWVADSGNGRVQHWDHIGTTTWMTDTVPPGDPGAPVNTGLPEVTGTPAAGSDLSCSVGSWEPVPASYAVGWLRDGLPIAGAADTTYRVVAADVGAELTCTVVATGALGAASAPAASEAFVVPGPDSPPTAVVRPEITGRARSGAVLHCSTGTWTGATPTSYVRGWLRDGQLLTGTNAADYLVTDNDVYHELTCRVAAVNRNGTGKAAISDPVEVEEGGSGGGVRAPENTRRPHIVGAAAVGADLFCDPGEWSGAPTFGYVWRRDGTAIGGSERDRYTVLPEDRRTELTCLVTGTNPSGSDAASSAPVVPTGSVGPDDPNPTSACDGAPSVRVDGGARYARTPSVVLSITPPSGATAVTISNDAGFTRAVTRSLTATCRYPWRLDSRSGGATKVVRVRFPGAAAAGTVSARVVLDQVAPRVRGVGARWSNPRHAWVLSIRATDRGTGLARVQVGKSKARARPVPWGRVVASADSSRLRWVRVLDRAGNASRWFHVRRF